jgi:hypothetical protein
MLPKPGGWIPANFFGWKGNSLYGRLATLEREREPLETRDGNDELLT